MASAGSVPMIHRQYAEEGARPTADRLVRGRTGCPLQRNGRHR